MSPKQIHLRFYLGSSYVRRLSSFLLREFNKMKPKRYLLSRCPPDSFLRALSAAYPRGNVSFSAKVARISCNVRQIPPISRTYRDENSNTPKGKRWHISIHFPFPTVGFRYNKPLSPEPLTFQGQGLGHVELYNPTTVSAPSNLFVTSRV